jgi:hypothetical protein
VSCPRRNIKNWLATTTAAQERAIKPLKHPATVKARANAEAMTVQVVLILNGQALTNALQVRRALARS